MEETVFDKPIAEWQQTLKELHEERARINTLERFAVNSLQHLLEARWRYLGSLPVQEELPLD